MEKAHIMAALAGLSILHATPTHLYIGTPEGKMFTLPNFGVTKLDPSVTLVRISKMIGIGEDNRLVTEEFKAPVHTYLFDKPARIAFCEGEWFVDV